MNDDNRSIMYATSPSLSINTHTNFLSLESNKEKKKSSEKHAVAIQCMLSNLHLSPCLLFLSLCLFLLMQFSPATTSIKSTRGVFLLLVIAMGYLNSVVPSASQVPGQSDSPVSGGGLSQNGKFSYGYASSPGKRSSMEDFYETRIDGVDGEIIGLFGVFDGHGGARAAEYVKENLFNYLISHPKFISDTKLAIADAYNHTDSEFLKSENNQHRDAGSTASTAILVGDRLLVANVGDSRAVISRGGNAIAVSRDHKPDQTDERQRIEDAGGFVMWAGTWRVGGVLAVSRAFGDRLLKQYVVADPEIQEEKVDSSLEFLILASDGLWDVVTNEEAVGMVKPIQDPEEAAKRLMQEAYQRGSADNITTVVVRFLEDQVGTSISGSS